MATGPAFNLSRLRPGLKPFRLYWFPRLRSTNDHAAFLRRKGRLYAPAAVLSGSQTAGRGRGGNIWWSSHGVLTVTFRASHTGTRPAAGVAPDCRPGRARRCRANHRPAKYPAEMAQRCFARWPETCRTPMRTRQQRGPHRHRPECERRSRRCALIAAAADHFPALHCRQIL